LESLQESRCGSHRRRARAHEGGAQVGKTADGFLQEAEQERKRAKKHYNAMAWYTDHPVEASRAVWRVASDDKAKDSKQAS